ncbi:MAG: MOSC domain-containing protein [Lachnospirales bacterium]
MKIISINISTEKGTVKKPVGKGSFLVNFGMENDAHGGDWHRQISLLGIESIEKFEKTNNVKLEYGAFAENITTSGVVLHELPIGTKMKINDVILEVTQIGKKCHLGCEISKQVGECVMPKEGIFAKVLNAGEIKNGDSIELL